MSPSINQTKAKRKRERESTHRSAFACSTLTPYIRSSPPESIGERPGRYNLRGRTATTSSTTINCSPTLSSSRPTASSRNPRSNPLDTLLREKKQADRKGRGSDAFQRAEKEILRKDLLRTELDDEDGEDWDGEFCAGSDMQQIGKSSSPVEDRSLYDLDEEAEARLLGEEQGAAVHAILMKDRHVKHDEEDTVFGVEMWETGGNDDHAMDTDADLPSSPQLQVQHPITDMFLVALKRHGTWSQSCRKPID